MVNWDISADNCDPYPSYNVYLNGAFIENVAVNTYDFSSLTAGTSYTAGIESVDADNNTTSMSTLTVSTTTVGIENYVFSGCAMYPNPAKNVVNFKSNETIKKIVIINLQGRIIAENAYNKQTKTLNICNLSKGTYFIKLYAENNKKMTDKLIVN